MSKRVPQFLSKRLAQCKTKDQKDNLMMQYTTWCDSLITQEFKNGLENQWKELTEKEDNKWEFLSKFQLTFSSGVIRGTRKALKQVIKQLTYEV